VVFFAVLTGRAGLSESSIPGIIRAIFFILSNGASNGAGLLARQCPLVIYRQAAIHPLMYFYPGTGITCSAIGRLYL